jgi:hypothetical protein
MLENEQAEDHFGGSRRPAATAFLGMSFGECLVNRRHALFISENLISLGHPFFRKIARLSGDQTLTEVELGAPHLNHGVSSVKSIRTQQIVVDLADRLIEPRSSSPGGRARSLSRAASRLSLIPINETYSRLCVNSPVSKNCRLKDCCRSPLVASPEPVRPCSSGRGQLRN